MKRIKREHGSCTVIILIDFNKDSLSNELFNRLDKFLFELYESCEKYKMTIGGVGCGSTWIDFDEDDYLIYDLYVDLERKISGVCLHKSRKE